MGLLDQLYPIGPQSGGLLDQMYPIQQMQHEASMQPVDFNTFDNTDSLNALANQQAIANIAELEQQHGRKLTPTEREAIVRQYIGIVTNQHVIPRGQGDNPAAVAAQQVQETGPAANFVNGLANSVYGGAAGITRAIGDDPRLGLTGGNEIARRAEKAKEQTIGVKPGISGFLGEAAGGATRLLEGPAVVPMAFAEGFGTRKLQIDKQRSRGAEISPARENVAALESGALQAAFDAVLRFVGGKASGAALERIVGKEGAEKLAQNFVFEQGKNLLASAAGGGGMAGGQELVNRQVGEKPQDLFDAFKHGAAMGAVIHGINAVSQVGIGMPIASAKARNDTVEAASKPEVFSGLVDRGLSYEEARAAQSMYVAAAKTAKGGRVPQPSPEVMDAIAQHAVAAREPSEPTIDPNAELTGMSLADRVEGYRADERVHPDAELTNPTRETQPPATNPPVAAPTMPPAGEPQSPAGVFDFSNLGKPHPDQPVASNGMPYYYAVHGQGGVERATFNSSSTADRWLQTYGKHGDAVAIQPGIHNPKPEQHQLDQIPAGMLAITQPMDGFAAGSVGRPVAETPDGKGYIVQLGVGNDMTELEVPKGHTVTQRDLRGAVQGALTGVQPKQAPTIKLPENVVPPAAQAGPVVGTENKVQGAALTPAGVSDATGTPSEQPVRPAAPPDTNAAIEAAKASIPNFGVAGKLSKPQVEARDLLNQRGKQVVFYRGDRGGGFTLADHPGVVFVHASKEGTSAVREVVGHELAHDDPAMADAVAATVPPETLQQATQDYKLAARQEGLPQGDLPAEAKASVLGWAATYPRVWSQLVGADKGLFQRVSDGVLRLFGSLTQKGRTVNRIESELKQFRVTNGIDQPPAEPVPQTQSYRTDTVAPRAEGAKAVAVKPSVPPIEGGELVGAGASVSPDSVHLFNSALTGITPSPLDAAAFDANAERVKHLPPDSEDYQHHEQMLARATVANRLYNLRTDTELQQQLVEKARNGDADAQTQLIASQIPTIQRQARMRGLRPGSQQFDDATQAGVLQLQRLFQPNSKSLAKWTPSEGTLTSWLARQYQRPVAEAAGTVTSRLARQDAMAKAGTIETPEGEQVPIAAREESTPETTVVPPPEIAPESISKTAKTLGIRTLDNGQAELSPTGQRMELSDSRSRPNLYISQKGQRYQAYQQGDDVYFRVLRGDKQPDGKLVVDLEQQSDNAWQKATPIQRRNITDAAAKGERVLLPAEDAVNLYRRAGVEPPANIRFAPSKLTFDPSDPKALVDFKQFINKAVDATQKGGIPRPELSQIADTEEGRTLAAMADLIRMDRGLPDRKTVADISAKADKLISPANVEKAKQALINSRQWDDTQVTAANKLISRMGFDGWDEYVKSGGKNMDKLIEGANLSLARRAVGTETGRALRMMQDPVLSPAQRARMAIASALLAPPTTKQGAIDTANYASFMSKIRSRMDSLGLDLNSLDNENLDPAKAWAVVHQILAARAPHRAALYEYYLASVLSGAATHARNTTGNVANIVMRMGVERPLAAAFADTMRMLGAKMEGAPRMGELRYMYPAIMKAMMPAMANTIKTMAYDVPVFDVSRGRYDAFEHQGMAIPGVTGRVIRGMGLTELQAADQFAKTISASGQAAAIAYRAGTEKGLKGKALTAFVSSEISDPMSESSQRGFDYATNLAFQDKLGTQGQKLLAWRDDKYWSKYLFPFMRTTGNIVKQGVDSTVLGTGTLAKDAVKGNVNAEQASYRVARQMVAWGVAAYIWNAADQITGPPPVGDPNERDAMYRQGRPPMTIRLGSHRYDYSGVEPLATTLGLTKSATDYLKRGLAGEDQGKSFQRFGREIMGLVANKTFLRTVGDWVGALEDPNKAERPVTNLVSSLVPNAYKSTARAMRDTVPQYDSRAGFGDKLLTSSVIEKPPAKVDVYGRDVRNASYGVGPVADKLLRTFSPVDVYPSENPSDPLVKVERMMDAYRRTHPDSKWSTPPAQPENSVQIGMKTVPLDPEETHLFREASGKLAAQMMTKVPAFNYEQPSERDAYIYHSILSGSSDQVRQAMQVAKIAQTRGDTKTYDAVIAQLREIAGRLTMK